MRIEQYIQIIDYALWDVIENGNSILKTRTINNVKTAIPPTTTEEKLQRRNEVKARITLMIGLPNEHQIKFNSFKDAKSQLKAIEKSTGVNTANGVNTASSQVNVASSLNIDNLSDAVICAFRASQPNSTQLVNEDLEQIHPDDLEEMDLKWQMAMLTMECRAPMGHDNKSRDITRKTVPVETPNSSALVSCDGLGGYDWSDQAEEGPKNYAPIAYSTLSASSSDSEDTMQFHHHTGLFPPLKSDLSSTGLEELFNEPKTKKSKYKSTNVKPKSVRKDSDAPIIKDWVSDDEEDRLGSNWEMFNKSCYECRSFEHLIRNCQHHQNKIEQQKVLKPVWNNRQGVNHKNHSNANRNHVPQAALTVNAARPFNSVHSKRTINAVNQESYFSKQAHSSVQGPNQKLTTLKNSYANKKVKIVWVKKVNTAKPKATVNAAKAKAKHNAIKGKMGNDVKASTYYEEIDGGYVSFGGNPKGGKIISKEEEMYVCQPPRFEDPDFPDKVYKVEKALYGLHQAPRVWYETLSTYLLDNGFKRGQIDKTLFIKRNKGDILLVQVYVDDIIFGSTKKETCDAFEILMHEKFQMSSMGELTFFLGLQCKKQIVVTKSTTKAEYVAASSCCGQVLWIQNQLLDYGPDIMFVIMVTKSTTKAEYVAASSCYGQTTVKIKTVNDDVRLQALIDGKKVVITEASIRHYLKLNDAEGTSCLSNVVIFEELVRMGAKTTSWNEFSSTMAYAIICLANNQKFNFSKYIIDNLKKNLEAGVPFYIFPRFIQVFVNHQLGDMSHHKDTPIPDAPSSSQHQRKHKTKRKERKETKVSPTKIHTEDHVPTTSNDPLPSGEDKIQLKELMDLCTNLSDKILNLENEVIKMKSSHKAKIAELQSRVKKLEEENMSLTNELKSFNTRVNLENVYNLDMAHKETVLSMQDVTNADVKEVAEEMVEVITTAKIIVDEVSTAG
nr:uncharacterized mitochondrial protein AtMg00810-like [Tanacetum cinerariifolium]